MDSGGRFRFPSVLAVAVALAGCGADPARSFQYDPVEYHGARYLAVALVAGIVLAAWVLVRALRRRVGGAHFGALVVTSLVMLPLLSLATGMLLVFQRAERVEFCASCHRTMSAYVDDMQDPGSRGLAAIHYRNRYIPHNQCYECHTSAGMFGTIEAKLGGIVDVFKYYTGTYDVPLRMRSPYPNADCLKCHAESALWLARAEHVAAREALFTERIKCMDCHGAANPAHPVGPDGGKP